jgi:uncharacterized integral membrane protein
MMVLSSRVHEAYGLGGVMTEPAGVQSDRRRLGVGTIASLVGLAVLLVFLIQNRESIVVHFLWLHFSWPLWLYTIIMALFGALVWFGLGVIRRHRRRVERRERR